jgi:hypothetical protein
VADTRLRELERKAASGDPQAEEALKRFKERIDPPERGPFHDLPRLIRNMGISIRDLEDELMRFGDMTRTFTTRDFDHTMLATAYALHAWKNTPLGRGSAIPIKTIKHEVLIERNRSPPED